MRNLTEEAVPPPDWFEDQVRPQQMLRDSRDPIINNDQRNHPPNSVAVSVHLTVRERTQCISAPDVTCAYAWCLVSQNITPE